MSANITIGLVVLTKDDDELIFSNLKYHLNLGIDFILVSDRGSSKKQVDKLKDFSQDKPIHVTEFDVHNCAPDSDAFINRRLNTFNEIRQHAPFSLTHVCVIDADEFIWCKPSSLKASPELQNSKHLLIERYNAALLKSSTNSVDIEQILKDGVQHTHVVYEREKLNKEIIEANPSKQWLMHAIMPKFITALDDIKAIHPGFHNVDSPSKVDKKSKEILIVHFPFTNLEKFKTKIQNIRSHEAQLQKSTTIPVGRAWHWHHWLNVCTDTEKTTEEYNRQFFSLETLTNPKFKRIKDI